MPHFRGYYESERRFSYFFFFHIILAKARQGLARVHIHMHTYIDKHICITQPSYLIRQYNRN